jgi:hypothetical protein
MHAENYMCIFQIAHAFNPLTREIHKQFAVGHEIIKKVFIIYAFKRKILYAKLVSYIVVKKGDSHVRLMAALQALKEVNLTVQQGVFQFGIICRVE